jgi:hypothetical protein
MKIYKLLIVCSLITSSCTDNSGYSKYEKLKKKELARNIREDSLFLGIKFKMTSKEFYAHCWEMNKKGLFTDGNDNTAVLHKLNNNELKHPGRMNFYPVFYQNKIYKMPVTFEYDGWAPWNKHFFSDSLLPDVLNLYQKWYADGNPFIKIDDKEKGTIYVKVDGNRRIVIGRFNDLRVKVDYTDLTVEKQQSLVNAD